MIYLTGDTHIPIDIGKLSCKSFPKQQEMTRSDYVIVLGDFGLLWKKDETYDYWLDVLSKRTYTLLFLDGNHENFDWLDSLPVETWHGGRVHRIAENILHLMRGEIFEIGGSTFFTLGGAVSYDKVFRAEGISWWPQHREPRPPPSCRCCASTPAHGTAPPTAPSRTPCRPSTTTSTTKAGTSVTGTSISTTSATTPSTTASYGFFDSMRC